MGVKERTTRGAPCIFCGDIGYDMRVHYPEQEKTIHWCHKLKAAKGETVYVGTEAYRCVSANKEINIGIFTLFEKELSKEEWIKRQQRINPDWKPYGKGASSRITYPKRMISIPQVCSQVQSDERKKLIGEEEMLPHRQLDKIYRAFLSMLILEDKHRNSLLKEWKSPVYDVSCLLSDYPIRSLPPIDKARYANGETFKNPTRRYIVSKLISMFGDLRGVPGFYLRSGSYWDDKPEVERWTFSSVEGIVFPCYDEEGYLYSIRVRDDYPNRKIKEGQAETYKGMYGVFSHFYDKNGKHCWSFTEKGGTAQIVQDVKPFGKIDGKYKCFSSIHEEMIDGKGVNTMEGGSSSGTPYSLYDKYSENYTVVFATEGEKKAMVGNAIKHFPVVSVAGVSNYGTLFKKGENGKSFLDVMKEKGMKYFVVCYDADKEDKDTVKKAEAGFVAKLKEYGVETRIGYWKKDFDKGLDDILLSGVDLLIGPAQ